MTCWLSIFCDQKTWQESLSFDQEAVMMPATRNAGDHMCCLVALVQVSPVEVSEW